jgi:DNA-binding SARP family transcriptional activator/tetratricopeptide (TPR) repeat protein
MDAAERAGDVAKAIHLAVNLAVTEIYSGRYSDALAHLDRAIEGAELFGLSTYVSWGLGVRGWARSRLGPSDESLLDCERALELFHGHSGQTAAPLIAMGDARRERGDLASAQAAYDEAIRRTTGQGDLQLLAPALAGLARTIAGDEPARARDLAERAVALPAGEHRAWVLCSAGWVVLADGDLERAQELAAEALDVAGGRYPDRAVLPEALELTVLSAADPTAETPRLDEARALWLDLPNELAAARVDYILARLGGPRSHRAATRATRRMQTLAGRADVDGRAAGAMMALGPADPPPLSIETLGRFRVLQRGEVLPPEAWRSRKARDLLKLLIARRGRGVPRDALIEALWPDDDPAKTANRLAVALSTVRTVLDPARRLPLNHYIGATGDAVALDLNTVAVDVEGFLADAQAGLSARGKDRDDEAVALLEAAEAAYYGDFLEESVYEDWAIDLREEARAAYAAVVTALAEHARARGDYDAETQYRLRVLERDRHDEGAHLALVSAFVAQGRHGEARRAYRGYATRMDEIGLEPAPFPLG